MTELSDELLVAYVDGQLVCESRRAVEKVLEQDDVTAARVTALQEAHGRLEAAFEAILAGEVSEISAQSVPVELTKGSERGGLAKAGLVAAGIVTTLITIAVAPPQQAEVAPPTWQEEAARASALLSRASLEVSLESQGNADLATFQPAQALGEKIRHEPTEPAPTPPDSATLSPAVPEAVLFPSDPQDPVPRSTSKVESELSSAEPIPAAEAPKRDSDAESPEQKESAETPAPATPPGESVPTGVKVGEPPSEPNAAKSQQPEPAPVTPSGKEPAPSSNTPTPPAEEPDRNSHAVTPGEVESAGGRADEPSSNTPAASTEEPDRNSHAVTPEEESAEAPAPATPPGESVPTGVKVGEPPSEPNAAKSQQPEPAPVTPSGTSKEKPEPLQARHAAKPKKTIAPQAKGRPKSKPITLGAGGSSKSLSRPAAGRASASAYGAKVRLAIGRHKPKAVGARGSATVSFAIGASGALRSVRIVRSSGQAQLDQAALASVRNAAPFPPPAGLNPGDLSYAIQIFFR